MIAEEYQEGIPDPSVGQPHTLISAKYASRLSVPALSHLLRGHFGVAFTTQAFCRRLRLIVT